MGCIVQDKESNKAASKLMYQQENYKNVHSVISLGFSGFASFTCILPVSLKIAGKSEQNNCCLFVITGNCLTESEYCPLTMFFVYFLLQQYDYDSSTVRKQFFQEALVDITLPVLRRHLGPSCRPVRDFIHFTSYTSQARHFT